MWRVAHGLHDSVVQDVGKMALVYLSHKQVVSVGMADGGVLSAHSDKELMKGTAVGSDPRAKVSMKKIFGKPNIKKDGMPGKVHHCFKQCAAPGASNNVLRQMLCSIESCVKVWPLKPHGPMFLSNMRCRCARAGYVQIVVSIGLRRRTAGGAAGYRAAAGRRIS